MRYRYLALEGNIGAGKTTLSRKLAANRGAKLVLEQFADNPFLPKFYADQTRYAFPLELSFLAERFSQLKREVVQTDLFQENIVADYFLPKSLIFAQSNLDRDEMDLFLKMYHIMQANLPMPDLLLYLHKSTPILQRNIKNRARSYEQNIEDAYLEKIERRYFEYFKTLKKMPIIILDADKADFLNEPDHFQKMKNILDEEHKPGISHFRI